MENRSRSSAQRLGPEVVGNLGRPMEQSHPTLYYLSSTGAQAERYIQPTKSRVTVDLEYEPRKKGLIWYQAYDAQFSAEYVVKNPTPIGQTVYAGFRFPAEDARYDQFTLSVGGETTDQVPSNGHITEAIILGPNEEKVLTVGYRSSGQGQWVYSFGQSLRVRDFALSMTTNFEEINMPMGTGSPTAREKSDEGWMLDWNYSDVIGAQAIGMDMPAVVNPGPVAARITFFAPVSLLFFFSVLVILGMVRGVDLHPMNYFFLAAGCFAFQLLFSYLVDLVPMMTAFGVSAAVSVILVSGYLWMVTNGKFARIAALAQLAFMVLFSYSFFFQGLTGITITCGAIVTLALLMVFTAKVNWETMFVKSKGGAGAGMPAPPPLP